MDTTAKIVDFVAFLIVGLLGLVVTFTGIIVASPGTGIRKIGEWLIRKSIGEGE